MAGIIRSYRDLTVWQKGVELAVQLYGVTRRFPSYERFGLSSQIQRSAVSIPANVAEGNSKSGKGHYLNHLSHATGSLSELETLLLIGHRVGYMTADAYRELLSPTDEIGRMLGSLTRSVARSDARGSPV
jgi:four helix bundle protein